MASPIGHAAVGIAAAAVVARATELPGTPALWLGAFIASGVPDLDFGLALFGLKGPRFHRSFSHSLFLLGAVVVAMWFLVARVPSLGPEIVAAWAAALLSHPLLDVVTTGPGTAARGYGIPLFWPLSNKGWHLQRPILETAAFEECRSVRDVWDGVRPEVVRIVPVALAVLVAAAVF
jgi:membrane-bound metal-dependent hydrolase YbcI (DUF457 family)